MSSDPVDRKFSRINESTASNDDLGAELEDSLTLYFRGLGRVPILSQAQERALFRRWEAGDERAKWLLVEANLPLVIWIARQYAHHDVPLLDLIQEGNVALTRAVEKFDHRLGFRLSTYATLSIRGAVERAAERHARVITVPIHVGRLIRAVRRSRQILFQRLNREQGLTVVFVTHDVQEAVLLAGRVAVMSARPGCIKTIVDTNFDKNDPAVFKSKVFVDKVDEVWGLVRDEAIKAQEGRAS